MYQNINDIIKKVKNNGYYNKSACWAEFTRDLETYLINGDLESYVTNNVIPHVFTWPQHSIQNMNQLNNLRKDPESIFCKTLKVNDYGPRHGIHLHENIQLDRVQQVWSIYNLVNSCGLSLDNDEIIFEFGAGTGQMADVLHNMQFKGRHVIYDLPLMTVLQKYFIDKRGIKNTYILDDDEPMHVINGTNFLPCNQPNSEKTVLGLPNVNFIATYSLTETDINTHIKFSEYMPEFSRIIIIYFPGVNAVADNINSSEYITMLHNKLVKTHDCHHGDNVGDANSKIFMAVKKTLNNPLKI